MSFAFVFVGGFNQVFAIEHLRCFNPHELKLLLCGNQWPSWALDDLLNYIEPSHGFTRERFVRINHKSIIIVVLLFIVRDL